MGNKGASLRDRDSDDEDDRSSKKSKKKKQAEPEEVWDIAEFCGSSRGFVDSDDPLLAKFDQPHGLALSGDESQLVVCDTGNRRIRLVDVRTGAVRTLAGSGEEHSKDGRGVAASFTSPCEGVSALYWRSLRVHCDACALRTGLCSQTASALRGTTTSATSPTTARTTFEPFRSCQALPCRRVDCCRVSRAFGCLMLTAGWHGDDLRRSAQFDGQRPHGRLRRERAVQLAAWRRRGRCRIRVRTTLVNR